MYVAYKNGKPIPVNGKAVSPEANNSLLVKDYGIHEYDKTFCATAVIKINNSVWGRVRIIVSKKKISKIVFNGITSFVIILLIFSILGTLGAYSIGTMLSNPIKKIVDDIHLIGRGDLDHRIKITTTDEISILGYEINNMTTKIQNLQKEAVKNATTNKEIEIAKNIQTSLLPSFDFIKKLNYDIATNMTPADEVGGDYFDILKDSDDNLWIGIGDVTGHGIISGLIMMMLHVSAGTLIKTNRGISPEEVLIKANNIIQPNIRDRLKCDHHITVNFIKESGNGRFDYAGAHETILIYRKKTNTIEELETFGMWLGIIPDINKHIKKGSGSFVLNKEDICLLYTDGLIQITNQNNEQYGIERLKKNLLNNCNESSEIIKNKILMDIENFKKIQVDDLSFVILKK